MYLKCLGDDERGINNAAIRPTKLYYWRMSLYLLLAVVLLGHVACGCSSNRQDAFESDLPTGTTAIQYTLNSDLSISGLHFHYSNASTKIFAVVSVCGGSDQEINSATSAFQFDGSLLSMNVTYALTPGSTSGGQTPTTKTVLSGTSRLLQPILTTLTLASIPSTFGTARSTTAMLFGAAVMLHDNLVWSQSSKPTVEIYVFLPYGVQVTELNGKAACPNSCSSHGTCQPTGTCQCDSPFSGVDCSMTDMFPDRIQLSDPDIGNPLRGLYNWLETVLAPVPYYDAYDRWSWKTFEPSEGVYDFTKLETSLSAAYDRKGKLGIRVIASDPYYTGNQVPDYMVTHGQQNNEGFWCANSNPATWVPDWNSEYFFTRLQALFDAMSQKYANDPRLLWLDVGIYGAYGEWHSCPEFCGTGCYDNGVGPHGETEPTRASKKRIIDIVDKAFPLKFKTIPFNDQDAVCISIMDYSKIGIRSDIVGGGLGTLPTLNYWPLVQYQWRRTPFIGEPNTYSGFQGFDVATEESKTFHLAMVGNGNLPYFSDNTWSDEQRAQWINWAKITGYRLTMNHVTFSSSVVAGGCFDIFYNITNEGYAPIYEDWNTKIRLTQNGNVVWESQSILEIRNVFPQETWTGVNSVALSVDLAPGQYEVSMIIADASDYRPPLKLANLNNQTDGSYLLGSTEVRSGTTQVTQCFTTTPQYTQSYLPGPVPSNETHFYAYRDDLEIGWGNKHGDVVTLDFASTDQVFSGNHSIALSLAQWGTLELIFSCPISTQHYNYLHFAIYATGESSGSFNIFLYNTPYTGQSSINLADGNGGLPQVGKWTEYKIPLSAWDGRADTTYVNLIGFQPTVFNVLFYIDDIYLVA